MEAITKDSEVNVGDMIYIKPINKEFTNNKEHCKVYGILRDKYDNENSLSGVLSKLIKIYKRDYKIIERGPEVFCWNGRINNFILLRNIKTGRFTNDYSCIELFKLNNQEVKNLNGLINKLKIVEKL
jgi:hypothetical protein